MSLEIGRKLGPYEIVAGIGAGGMGEVLELQVHVMNWPDLDEKRQVSTHGGAMPRWRGGGRELFYIQEFLRSTEDG